MATKVSIKVKGTPKGAKKALAALAAAPEISNEPVLREADARRALKKA